ncbi:MAG: VCBS repeat-containing protein [Clostridiales bacterium]|nr:VCBS repeat-containing protein [Clostridiales bacterium]
MKNIKKITVLLCLLLSAAVLFGGCDVLSFTAAENLVRPPKLTGTNGDLQDAFENAVSDIGEFILRYPSSGDYRSAYVTYDCDGDGVDEAFVFYSPKTEEMSVYMYMLNYSDGEWKAVGEILGDGSDIYSIEFCDLNDDGISEILVGWSSLDSKNNKKLSVYCSYKNSQNLNYRILALESYTEMYTEDLDGDGEVEILVALINSTSDTYTTDAKLLKMSDGDDGSFQISAVGQTSLYSEITAVTAISSGYSGGKKYIYIDEAADSLYLTELICWDDVNQTITAPISVDLLSVASCPTSRAVSLVCTDIDGDGELEIPSTVLLQNGSVVRRTDSTDTVTDSSDTQQENIYITKWSKYDDGNYTAVSEYISNDTDCFTFNYDEEFMADKSVTFYYDEHVTQFYAVVSSEDEANTEETVLLFTITAVELTDTVSIGAYLTVGSQWKYIYEITGAGEEAGITKLFIENNFSPYEESTES